MFFIPIIALPIFVLFIFKQWATHPFGIIPFLPAIALGIGFLFENLIKKLEGIGVFIIILIFGISIYLSYENLNFFYNQFLILTEEDIALAKNVAQNINPNESICLGQNPGGVGVDGILWWYTRKNINTNPNCYKQNNKFALVFHPQTGQLAQEEIKKFESANYKFLGCAGFLCLMQK